MLIGKEGTDALDPEAEEKPKRKRGPNKPKLVRIRMVRNWNGPDGKLFAGDETDADEKTCKWLCDELKAAERV